MSSRYSLQVRQLCRNAASSFRQEQNEQRAQQRRQKLLEPQHQWLAWRKRHELKKKEQQNDALVFQKKRIAFEKICSRLHELYGDSDRSNRPRSLASSAARVTARCLNEYAKNRAAAESFRCYVPPLLKTIILTEVARMSLNYLTLLYRKRDRIFPVDVSLRQAEPNTTTGVWSKRQITNIIAFNLFSYSRLEELNLSFSLVTSDGLEKILRSNEAVDPNNRYMSDERFTSGESSDEDEDDVTWEEYISREECDGNAKASEQQSNSEPDTVFNAHLPVTMVSLRSGYAIDQTLTVLKLAYCVNLTGSTIIAIAKQARFLKHLDLSGSLR